MLQWLVGAHRVPSGTGEQGGAVPSAPHCGQASPLALSPFMRQAERMARIGFWRYDLASRQFHASPQVFAIHGVAGKPNVDFSRALEAYPQPHRAVIEAALDRAKRLGEPYDLELDLIAADGTRKRIRSMAEPEWEEGKIVALIGVMQDISERFRLEEELRTAAATDALTGLPNRRQLEQVYAAGGYGRVEAGNGPFALAIIDVDHFKQVNDTHGHAAGDAALQVLAGRLHAGWLGNSFAARLAGDEFVLLVTDQRLVHQLPLLCERLLGELARPVPWNGDALAISATVGVAVSEAGGSSISDMLECADAALYVAKNKGRGTAAITTREDLFMQDPAAMGQVRRGTAA